MYNFMKKGAFMLLVACLAMGMASCSDDDPDYSNVTPPTVAVTHSISGRVTGLTVRVFRQPFPWAGHPQRLRRTVHSCLKM
mgnify:CR=1 FL=1